MNNHSHDVSAGAEAGGANERLNERQWREREKEVSNTTPTPTPTPTRSTSPAPKPLELIAHDAAQEIGETAAWEKDCILERAASLTITEAIREATQPVCETLHGLRREIEPMAKQIICPTDNTFTRQLTAIDAALAHLKNPCATEK